MCEDVVNMIYKGETINGHIWAKTDNFMEILGMSVFAKLSDAM